MKGFGVLLLCGILIAGGYWAYRRHAESARSPLVVQERYRLQSGDRVGECVSFRNVSKRRIKKIMIWFWLRADDGALLASDGAQLAGRFEPGRTYDPPAWTARGRVDLGRNSPAPANCMLMQYAGSEPAVHGNACVAAVAFANGDLWRQSCAAPDRASPSRV